MNIPWSEPEKHNRVEFVDVGYTERGKHEEKNDMAENEVGCKQSQLGDLAQVFSSRLRH